MNTFQDKQEKLLAQSQGIIFPYSDRWVESHKAFAEKMWPGKMRRRDEVYNRWKFRGLQQGDVNGLLLAVVDGQVVGQLGLIPAKLWVDGQVYQAQWACDLMVDKDVRQMGLGSMLFAVAMDRGWVTLGSEPSPLADITMSRIGFKPLVGPEKMILPLDVCVVLNWVMGSRWERLATFLAKIAQPFQNLRIEQLKNRLVEGVREGNMREAIPLVAAYQASIAKPHIIHGQEYLTWRYQSPIETNITTLISPGGGYAICEAGNRDYYVYDWYAPGNRDAVGLFSVILRRAVEAGCQNVLAYTNNEAEKSILRKNGFLKMRTPLKVIYHSKEPVLDNHQNFHYCIYDSDGNL